MQNTYDTPTYPELGNIYPGDYYEALPYDEFIDKNQKLPEGKKVFDIRDFGAIPFSRLDPYLLLIDGEAARELFSQYLKEE